MTYVAVQLCAFELDISQQAYLPEHLSASPSRPQSADMQMRISWLLDAVKCMAERVGGPPAGVLRVVLVPEFFLACSQVTNACSECLQYQHSDLNNALGMLMTLAQQEKCLSHTVLACGTMLSGLPSDAVSYDCSAAMLNTALIVNGGPSPLLKVYSGPWKGKPGLRAPTHMHYVHKSVVAGTDPYNDTPTENAMKNAWYKQHLEEDYLAHFFYVDNISFVLEVCRDHREGRAKQILSKWRDGCISAGTPAPNVDVHLIVACGMRVNNINLCVRKGGVIMRCDGQSMLRSELGRAGPEHSYCRISDNIVETITLEKPSFPVGPFEDERFPQIVVYKQQTLNQ